MEIMSKTAIVTGGSSGIGLETAKKLAEMGFRVYALSRHPKAYPTFVSLECDVTDEKAVKHVVKKIALETGHIDLLINAAGFGISGAVEFTDTEDAKRLFDTNFFGMVRMNKAVIPLMRARKHGRIINISSVAAPAGIPFQAYYSASKAAIDSYTLALRNELRPFGISVGSILPGDIKTGFTAAREKSTESDDIYQGRITRSVKGMEHDEETGIDPAAAGAFIARVATKRFLKPQTTLGGLYRGAVVLLRLLPVRLSNYLVYLLYAK